MGCAQSRIDNEEAVSRCKDRRNLIKDAVIARNAFAAGHSGYAVALKNTGAALSDYGNGEAEEPQQQSVEPTTSEPPPLPPPPPPIDNMPPPPPPLPNFSPSPSPSPIKRSTSMPIKPRKMRAIAIAEEEEEDEVEDEDDDEEEEDEGNTGVDGGGIIAKDSRNEVREVGPPLTPEMKAVPPMPESKGTTWDYFFMMEETMAPAGPSLSENVVNQNTNEGLAFGQDNRSVGLSGGDSVEPKTPERVEKKENEDEKLLEHAQTAPPQEFKRMGKALSRICLMKILGELDDHFLKASQSAQEVSKMLEATRLHYHSNFADNRGDLLFSSGLSSVHYAMLR